MKKIQLLNILAIILLLAASCGKDGNVGPAGPAGSTGLAGPVGAAGATGADGTKIYSGTTVPPASTGIVGDFYLNTATSGFYGPKTAAGWGTPFSLIGATGATGAAGATIRNGTAVPDATIGVNGDFYLNTVSYLFYGPKIGGAWPAPVNLKGPKGDTGTANVIYSDWITPTSYVKTTVFSTTTFTYNIIEPKITQDILDKGVVLVYGRLNGYNPVIWPTDQVSVLPIIITYLQGTTPEIDTWSGLYTLGNVQISVKNNNNVYSSISNAHSYRYVIIPGGVKVNEATLKNYAELKSRFNIKD